jgi:CBS domain-containing protein
MRVDVPTAEVDEPLVGAMGKLASCDCRSVPVLDRGELVGLLTVERVGEIVAVREAMAPA